MTLKDWRKFQSDWILLRGRVDDRTEGEEYRMLLRRLPEKWRILVGVESHNRTAKNLWVRMSNMPDITRVQLHNHLTSKEFAVKEVKPVENGYLVRCQDEGTRTQILKKYDGANINGKTIRVARTENRLTPDEILEFVETKLQIAEEMNNFDCPSSLSNDLSP